MPSPLDPVAPSGWRSFLQTSALLVGGALVGLLLAELAARTLYERPWYDQLADGQRHAETLDYELNSYGLRGTDFVIPKPERTRRVYMAGDSFTFGMGVADQLRVMPTLVEQSLNADLPTDEIDKVTVLNGGMLRGSLPRHWWTKWQRVAPEFDPDVVLIVFFLRDGTDTGSIPAFFGVVRDEITARNAADPAYRHLYLYRMVRDALDRDLVATRYTQAFRDAYFGSEAEQKEWRSAQYNVLQIRDAAVSRGAAVGFVIYPILVDLDREEYPFQDICDRLERFAVENDLPVLNLLDAFRGRHGPDLWVSSFDQHPNAAGHAIAAEAITPFVADLLTTVPATGTKPAHSELPEKP